MTVYNESAAAGPRDERAGVTELLYPGQSDDLGAEYVQERDIELNDLGLNRSIHNVSCPRLTAYLPDPDAATGVGMLVIPGGGFMHLAIDKEGYDIARWLNGLGVAAFVLKYRTAIVDPDQAMPTGEPTPEQVAAWRAKEREMRQDYIPLAVQDAHRGLRIMRARAEEFGLDPRKLGVIGFSAGGYLTVELGVGGQEGDGDAADPIERASSRPDFMVPMYPANPPNALERVDERTAPAFIVQAFDDFLPIENSLSLASALAAAKVSAEAHLYAQGGHGFGLGVNGGPVASWTERFADWLALLT